MKAKSYLSLLLLIMLFVSCEKDNNNTVTENYISLEIYSIKFFGYDNQSIWPQPMGFEMEQIATRKMREEGEICLSFIDSSVSEYMLFAKSKGYYTNQYYFNSGDTLTIDLDTVVPGKACGTVFLISECGPPWPLVGSHLTAYHNGDSVFSFLTDDFGRFAIEPREGTYELGYSEEFFVDFYPGAYYSDYTIERTGGCIVAYKPNIYIYPEETKTLDLKLDFPNGGDIITSIPEYNKGWKDLNVEPNGTINGEFGFLFYECINPDLYQRKAGWIIPQNELEIFFRTNLATTGFTGQEIEDFIDYWIPLLKDYPFYTIYPQYNKDLERVVKINLSETPDNVIRLFYLVDGRENNSINLEYPLIPAFSRDGFTVTEWGVVLSN